MNNAQPYPPPIIEKNANISQLSQRLAFVENEVNRIRASICVEVTDEVVLQRNIRLYQELIDLIKEAAEIMLGLIDNLPGSALEINAEQMGRTIHNN
jgi:hypothetical protein